jgi:hypothetical protein
MLKSLCAIIDGCTCKNLVSFSFLLQLEMGKGSREPVFSAQSQDSFLSHTVKIQVYFCSMFVEVSVGIHTHTHVYVYIHIYIYITGHYLPKRSTLDIGVLGFFGIV